MLLLVFGWARLSILFSKRIDFLPEDSRLVDARQLIILAEVDASVDSDQERHHSAEHGGDR